MDIFLVLEFQTIWEEKHTKRDKSTIVVGEFSIILFINDVHKSNIRMILPDIFNTDRENSSKQLVTTPI